jgi:hypothetical protein
MTRNHWMMLGFFLAIVGMFAFAVAPRVGMILVWLGAVLAWFGMAVAIEKKPWTAGGKRLLQILLGASAFALALTASPFSGFSSPPLWAAWRALLRHNGVLG